MKQSCLNHGVSTSAPASAAILLPTVIQQVAAPAATSLLSASAFQPNVGMLQQLLPGVNGLSLDPRLLMGAQSNMGLQLLNPSTLVALGGAAPSIFSDSAQQQQQQLLQSLSLSNRLVHGEQIPIVQLGAIKRPLKHHLNAGSTISEFQDIVGVPDSSAVAAVPSLKRCRENYADGEDERMAASVLESLRKGDAEVVGSGGDDLKEAVVAVQRSVDGGNRRGSGGCPVAAPSTFVLNLADAPAVASERKMVV